MKILILGFGKTGKAVYDFLKKRDYDLAIYDERTIEGLPVPYYSYARLKEELPLFDLCVRSPGVSRKSRGYLLAETLSEKMISDIELALPYVKSKHIVAVSGTNGKTTTCRMIGALLRQKYRVYVLGNIGQPLIEKAEEILPDDIVVLEMSSYLLEKTVSLHSEVVVLTSLSPNHLDGNHNVEGYYASKKRILFLRPRLFLCDENAARILKVEGKKAKDTAFAGGFSKINAVNLARAAEVARFYGLSEDEIQKGIGEIHLDPYRQEIVARKGGTVFVNDSKSTSSEATNCCLSACEGKRILLILSGRFKGCRIDEIDLRLAERVYAYGEIAALLPECVRKRSSLREILEEIRSEPIEGGYVVFSPGGSSFDRYRSYEERGKEFNLLVDELWS